MVNNKGKERKGEKQNDSRHGSEVKKKKTADARNKGEESWPGPGGKNIWQRVHATETFHHPHSSL